MASPAASGAAPSVATKSKPGNQGNQEQARKRPRPAPVDAQAVFAKRVPDLCKNNKWAVRGVGEEKWGQEWRNTRCKVYACNGVTNWCEVAKIIKNETGKAFIVTGTHGDGKASGITKQSLRERDFGRQDRSTVQILEAELKEAGVNLASDGKPYVFDISQYKQNVGAQLTEAIKAQKIDSDDYLIKAFCNGFECFDVDRLIWQAFQPNR